MQISLEIISKIPALPSLFRKRKRSFKYDEHATIFAYQSHGLDDGSLCRISVGSREVPVMLRVIDDEWKDHLYEMDMLKEGIHLRAYGQKDPLMEYKREAFYLFESLIDRINEKTLNILWKFQVQEEPESPRRRMPAQRMRTVHENAVNLGFAAAEESDIQKASRERSEKLQPVRVEQKVGRNDPCPCGSGKKYKKCCGAV